MPLIAIAALATNKVIGLNNSIPWHSKEDFQHFKRTTMGAVLIMGRKTYESIGRPLPGRTTVVLSRSVTHIPGITVCSSMQDALNQFQGQTIFLAGGSELYKEYLPLCSELVLTHMDLEPQGDAYFPEYSHLFDEGTVIGTGPNFTIRKHLRLSTNSDSSHT